MGDSQSSSRISVHKTLGGGAVADVLLWKKWRSGIVFLASATTLWFLFEKAGYNLLTFVADVFLLLVVILFFWGKSASLLNRPLPPLPDMEISEETVVMVADVVRVRVNYLLSIVHKIAVGRNIRVFLQVAVLLWVVSYIGSLCNFLTLVYIGVLISLSVPVLYDTYQDQINENLCIARRFIRIQYRKLLENILKNLPPPKEKKAQ